MVETSDAASVAALGLAIAAAVLPYVGTSSTLTLPASCDLFCLGLGGLVILYLLTQNLRYVGVGLVVVLSGYALEFVGALARAGPANSLNLRPVRERGAAFS